MIFFSLPFECWSIFSPKHKNPMIFEKAKSCHVGYLGHLGHFLTFFASFCNGQISHQPYKG